SLMALKFTLGVDLGSCKLVLVLAPDHPTERLPVFRQKSNWGAFIAADDMADADCAGILPIATFKSQKYPTGPSYNPVLFRRDLEDFLARHVPDCKTDVISGVGMAAPGILSKPGPGGAVMMTAGRLSSFNGWDPVAAVAACLRAVVASTESQTPPVLVVGEMRAGAEATYRIEALPFMTTTPPPRGVDLAGGDDDGRQVVTLVVMVGASVRSHLMVNGVPIGGRDGFAGAEFGMSPSRRHIRDAAGGDTLAPPSLLNDEVGGAAIAAKVFGMTGWRPVEAETALAEYMKWGGIGPVPRMPNLTSKFPARGGKPWRLGDVDPKAEGVLRIVREAAITLSDAVLGLICAIHPSVVIIAGGVMMYPGFEMDFLTRLKEDAVHALGPDAWGSMRQRVERAEKTGILTLSDAKLTHLPVDVLGIKTLKSLDVPHGSITKWTDLKIVNLSTNLFSKLPAELFLLSKLESLNLAHNALTTLPDAIGDLKKLKTLLVSHNLLISIPATLSSLPLLVTLDLSFNKITSFPASLLASGTPPPFPALQELDLTSNDLAAVPSEVGAIPGLKAIRLAGNARLATLPEELLGSSVTWIETDIGREVLRDMRNFDKYEERRKDRIIARDARG
ncbi:hypothetical protein HK101_003096, partial [Irineochytrium annulatum]